MDISQARIIAAINDVLINTRDYNDDFNTSWNFNSILANLDRYRAQIAQFSKKGYCHGFSIASLVRSDFEEELRYFLQASPQERRTLGTRANSFAYWLIEFVPFYQNPKNPFVGINAQRLSYMDSITYAGLKVLGKYTPCLTMAKLAESLAYLHKEPCDMLFIYNNHTIRISYADGKYSIYDPNNPKGTRTFANVDAAAQEIAEIFVDINREDLPNKLKSNFKFTATIVVVQKEANANVPKPTAFMDRLRRISPIVTDSSTMVDVLGIDPFRMALLRGDTRDFSALPMEKYVEKVADLPEDLESVLRSKPLENFVKLLSDQDFLANVAALTKNHNLDICPMLAKYNAYPEIKFVATCIFLLIKKGRSLEDLLINDYLFFKDPTLITLFSADLLKKIANVSNDLAIQKKVMEKEVDDYVKGLSKNPNYISMKICLSYLQNDIRIFEVLLKHKEKLESRGLISTINKLIEFAIYDDKPEWLELSLYLFPQIAADQIKAWLNIAVRYQSMKTFRILAQKLDNYNLLSLNLLLQAADNSKPEFFDFLIGYLTERNILAYNALQSNMKGEYPIHVAAFKGKKKHVKSLIDLNNGEIDTVSYRNETPLYIVCARGYEEMATMLFAKLPIPKFVMPNKMNIFKAASNSTNKNMLDHICKLCVERYTAAELCKVLPLEIITSYFLDYINIVKSEMFNQLMQSLQDTYALDKLLANPTFNYYFSQQYAFPPQEEEIFDLDLSNSFVPNGMVELTVSDSSDEDCLQPRAVSTAVPGSFQRSQTDAILHRRIRNRGIEKPKARPNHCPLPKAKLPLRFS